MAYCPKCNYKLRIRDYKPECPQCGVNILYYGMEERLAREADAAEKEHAEFQPKIDRVKAAVYGSKVAIARLVMIFLPILSLLLPLGKVTMNLPFYETSQNITVNLISIVKLLSNLNFDLVLKMVESPMFGKVFIFFLASIVCLILSLLVMLANLFVVALSCSPKGLPRNFTLAGMGIVFSSLSAVFFQLMGKQIASVVPGSVFTSKLSFGLIFVLASFVALIVVNAMFKILKIEVKYTDVSDLLKPFEQRQKEKAEREAAIKAAEAEKAEAATAGATAE
jgi:hypothetical protein